MNKNDLLRKTLTDNTFRNIVKLYLYICRFGEIDLNSEHRLINTEYLIFITFDIKSIVLSNYV